MRLAVQWNWPSRDAPHADPDDMKCTDRPDRLSWLMIGFEQSVAPNAAKCASGMFSAAWVTADVAPVHECRRRSSTVLGSVYVTDACACSAVLSFRPCEPAAASGGEPAGAAAPPPARQIDLRFRAQPLGPGCGSVISSTCCMSST